ncbi:hypothetical protein [Halomarina pelagica]|uniref:hypothetical protein n=1 Tax=Halomarina pelagica TaxID=2961599 RepID=UPI0020C53E62|nr:hypothetical protein [Halomarina sp. BND7]
MNQDVPERHFPDRQEPFPELPRCLRCRALSPPDGGDFPFRLDYRIETLDGDLIQEVSGSVCSLDCLKWVNARPSLYSEDFEEPPEPEFEMEGVPR